MTGIADGSNKTGGDGTSVGVGVAINVVTPDVVAQLTNGANVDGTNVTVKALVPTSKVEGTATSGAGGSNLGVAGSLVLNTTVLNALVSGTVDVNGANLSLTAESTVTSTALAKAKVDGSGDATGVGASVAINISDNETRAALANAALLNNTDDLTLKAKSKHAVNTEARGGATGGTSITPVVAVAIDGKGARVL